MGFKPSERQWKKEYLLLPATVGKNGRVTGLKLPFIFIHEARQVYL